MDIGHIAGNAMGGAVGGAVAGALIGFAMHKKLDKKLAMTGAGVFAGLAVVSTLIGIDIPLVPKTGKLFTAGPLPYGSQAGANKWLASQVPSSTGLYGPWYAPNYYY